MIVALRVLSAVIAAVLSPAAWLIFNSAPIRTKRLKVLLHRPVEDLKLPTGVPLIQRTPLVTDIEDSICSNRGGVNIIWAPQGAGKTTAVRRVLKSLQTAGKISGAIIINTPDGNSRPSEWFRSALRDRFGNLLKPFEKMSDILPRVEGRPFVFVLDQIDNAPMVDSMRVFLKTLAEDSCLTRSYVTFVLCSDPTNAKIMWEWNGRHKITLLSDFRFYSPVAYRWKEKEINQWLYELQTTTPSFSLLKEIISWERLAELAIAAGTPGFLVEVASSLKIVASGAAAEAEAEGGPGTGSSRVVTAAFIDKYMEEWEMRAKYKSTLWDMGEKVLEHYRSE